MTRGAGRLRLTRGPGHRRLAHRVMASPPRRPTRLRRRRHWPHFPFLPPRRLARRMTCRPRRPQSQLPHTATGVATAGRRRRLAQRVAASPARRPTCCQRPRRPSHTATTPHNLAPSYPDRLPKVHVPSKKTLLFLQPLPPQSPMLRRRPPPSQSTALRRQPAISSTSALRRSTSGNGNGRDRSRSHATRNHTTPHANISKEDAL